MTLTGVVSSLATTPGHTYTFRGKLYVDQSNSLHVSTSMESPMSFVSRLWMFLIPSVTRFWCETLSSVSIL